MNPQAEVKLGVVAFLNSRPLIEGLDQDADMGLHFAVPSALARLLRTGRVDAALVPVIDVARSGGRWERISTGGILSDGETLTVRVFSRVPPERLETLHVDGDSHTSVVLARLIWQHWYRRLIQILPLQELACAEACASVLLIGDKVVTDRPRGFDHEVDLGLAWKQWTGLPFVFAVWAANAGAPGNAALSRRLDEARDRGVARAADLAREHGPLRGWPADLAVRYLTQNLSFRLTPEAVEGMRRFISLATAEGLAVGAEERVT